MGEADERTNFQFGQWEIMMNLAFRVLKVVFEALVSIERFWAREF